MGLPKRLTEMQRRFAEYLVFGGPDGPVTKSEAAILAGYSKDRSRQEGSELTNPKHSPLVVKYIGELREERLKKYENPLLLSAFLSNDLFFSRQEYDTEKETVLCP